MCDIVISVENLCFIFLIVAPSNLVYDELPPVRVTLHRVTDRGRCIIRVTVTTPHSSDTTED